MREVDALLGQALQMNLGTQEATAALKDVSRALELAEQYKDLSEPELRQLVHVFGGLVRQDKR